MAADGGGAAPALTDLLYAQSRRFDFFQAVALLERMFPGAVTPGSSAEPTREPVRFSTTVRLASPTAAIEAIERPPAGEPGARPQMTVNFMGVTGPLGPLPLPFAELVLRRTLKGDAAAREFLDLFNHRLVSLAYRIRQRHTIGLGVRAPEDDAAYRYLRAVVGLGAPELGGRLGPVQDGTVVAHAGLFGKEQRSMAGLAAILGAHFGVPVAGVPLTGASYPLEPGDVTAIGPSGRCRRLGRDAVLGARFWDQESAFDLRIGPLDRASYLRLLPPSGDRLLPLCRLTRLYAGDALDFRVRLVLDPAAARAAKPRSATPPPAAPMTLGERPRLGYTAWAGRPWGRREVVLSTTRVRELQG